MAWILFVNLSGVARRGTAGRGTAWHGEVSFFHLARRGVARSCVEFGDGNNSKSKRQQ
jgi:hypothetical protein